MCSPGAAAGASVLGTGMSAYGQYQTGKANQQIAERNARIKEAQAKDAIERGKITANQRRQEGAQEASTQRVMQAANGIVVDRDSAAEIVADTAYISELDAMTIETNADREAYDLRTGAANDRFEGSLARKRGSQQVISTVLGGAADAYSIGSK